MSLVYRPNFNFILSDFCSWDQNQNRESKSCVPDISKWCSNARNLKWEYFYPWSQFSWPFPSKIFFLQRIFLIREISLSFHPFLKSWFPFTILIPVLLSFFSQQTSGILQVTSQSASRFVSARIVFLWTKCFFPIKIFFWANSLWSSTAKLTSFLENLSFPTFSQLLNGISIPVFPRDFFYNFMPLFKPFRWNMWSSLVHCGESHLDSAKPVPIRQKSFFDTRAGQFFQMTLVWYVSLVQRAPYSWYLTSDATRVTGTCVFGAMFSF